MLIVYILIFIIVFIYLLFNKNRYQSFALDIKGIVTDEYKQILEDIETDTTANTYTYTDFNTKIKAVYDKVFDFLGV